MGVRRPPVEGWTNYRIQRARSWRMDMLSLGESFVPDAYVERRAGHLHYPEGVRERGRPVAACTHRGLLAPLRCAGARTAPKV